MWLIYLFLNPIIIAKFLQLLRSNENGKYPLDAKGKITSLKILFCNYYYFLLAAVITFLLCDTEMYYYLQFNVLFFHSCTIGCFHKTCIKPPCVSVLWGFFSFFFFFYVRKRTNSSYHHLFSYFPFPLFFSDAFLNLRLSFDWTTSILSHSSTFHLVFCV